MHNSGSNDNHLSNIFFTLFCILPVSLFLYTFYGEQIRFRLEEDLFDLRTRLKPTWQDTNDIVVVTIDQKDLINLDLKYSETDNLNLLKKLVEKAHLFSPKALALIWPHHDLNYNSHEFKEFLTWMGTYKDTYFGTFDLNFNVPTVDLSPGYLTIPCNKITYSVDSFIDNRKSVLREMPIFSYRGDGLEEHLMFKMADEYANESNKKKIQKLKNIEILRHQNDMKNSNSWSSVPLPQIILNYIPKEKFITLSLQELLKQKDGTLLKNKIVLIGSSAYRKLSYEYRNGTYVNTPWQGEMSSEAFGVPYIFLLANQLSTLISGRWLVRPHFFWSLGHVIIFSTISFFIWRLAPFLAVVVYGLILCGLFYLHSLFYCFFNLNVPLADSVLFSILATITGAFLRAHDRNQLFREKIRIFELKKKLAIIQTEFLESFASGLYGLNKKVSKKLISLNDLTHDNRQTSMLIEKAIMSSLELEEYLHGIMQFSYLTRNQKKQQKITAIHIRNLLEKIANQFEHQIEERKIAIKIESRCSAIFYSYEVYLESVVFNLISNAVKYTKDESTIYIDCYECPGAQLVIDVIDQGPGIAEEYHEKIFEKFYRIKTDQVYRIKGNGLGLYLCRYFAEKMGAIIKLQSKKDFGSKFSLIFEKNF